MLVAPPRELVLPCFFVVVAAIRSVPVPEALTARKQVNIFVLNFESYENYRGMVFCR